MQPCVGYISLEVKLRNMHSSGQQSNKQPLLTFMFQSSHSPRGETTSRTTYVLHCHHHGAVVANPVKQPSSPRLFKAAMVETGHTKQ
jgi:hypothetical protein